MLVMESTSRWLVLMGTVCSSLTLLEVRSAGRVCMKCSSPLADCSLRRAY